MPPGSPMLLEKVPLVTVNAIKNATATARRFIAGKNAVGDGQRPGVVDPCTLQEAKPSAIDTLFKFTVARAATPIKVKP